MDKLWALLQKIPRGKVTTYGELAKMVNTSPRAIGAMLHANPNMPTIPCHRVVMSDGRIGGYSKGVKKKVHLLQKEGVKVTKFKVDLDKHLFRF